jgi:uncharacterized protein YdeI (YjbR/CyaY-like superfamily)
MNLSFCSQLPYEILNKINYYFSAMYKFKSVDEFYDSDLNNIEIARALRQLLRATELKEELKWAAPCYTFGGKHVVGIGCFKEHCALWFHQGVFLSDKSEKLIAASDSTRGLRQWRFNRLSDVNEELIMSYILEAIENAKKGKEIEIKEKELVIPDELNQALNEHKLQANFESFSKSKKREFAEYIDSAKQEKTKLNRLEKILPMITEGIGLNDKYRK